MKKKLIPLSSLPIGKKGIIFKTTFSDIESRRMLDLGIIEGTHIIPLYKSPFGNPTAYSIRGGVFALREETAKNILVKKI